MRTTCPVVPPVCSAAKINPAKNEELVEAKKSQKETIAILFYLWQKSYCFLGHKQQATVDR